MPPNKRVVCPEKSSTAPLRLDRCKSGRDFGKLSLGVTGRPTAKAALRLAYSKLTIQLGTISEGL